MKSGVMIYIPAVTIILYCIININSENLYRISKSSEQSEFQVSEPNNFSGQEKKKYLYLGAEKCASVCHNNDTMGFQFNSWNTSPHKDAYKILDSKKAQKYAREADLQENPMESQACLKCHVTASDLDSSYLSATYRKEDGVTCEACHKHYYDGKTYLPKEADCLICHKDSPHKISKFDYSKACAKIAHPRPKVASEDSLKMKAQ